MPDRRLDRGRICRWVTIGALTVAASLPTAAASRNLPEVTNIRYWSTPVYTRVAINLQREVRYEAMRAPGVNRVYFDFYGAKLSPSLRGESDQVIDHGFLHHIRAVQLPGDIVRVALDVTSISEYSAFFLTNPARLIIDVHASKDAASPYIPTKRAGIRAPGSAHGRPSVKGFETGNAARAAFNTQRTVENRAEPIRETSLPPLSPAGDLRSTDSRVRTVRRNHSIAPPRLRASSHPTRAMRPEPEPGKQAVEVRHPPVLVRATPEPTFGPVAQSVAGTTPAPEALTSAGAPPSMTRVLGLKIHRIVIDAGHGGHDPGAIGPGGIEEKNIALDVALRLGDLLRERLGAEVVYTRDDDAFVPLETRTALANEDEADLFLSIHANASSDPAARGVAVYYLGLTHSPAALALAARENAASNESIHELSTLVRKIALASKLDESRRLADDVDESLYGGLEAGNPGLTNRGVKQAPFVVLIGANMPSILAEISFITNPEDASEMEQPSYRERIAKALYRGVARYVEGLDGIRLAGGPEAGAP